MTPNTNDPPLDEIQWRSPQMLHQMGGLHSNTILFYFAESPFFERTSNNGTIMNQAMINPNMYHLIQTREAFEGRLRLMNGLEFIVGEEPAETGPGMGTGVWVIRKQTRRSQHDVAVHATYFVVGENIYMAPTLGNILASRIMTISSAIAKALPAAESAKKWRPSLGHIYNLPTTISQAKRKVIEPKEATPINEGSKKSTQAPKADDISMDRVAEESFMIHLRYGGDYIDENPITGRPGEFHLSSTGRKPVPPPQLGEQAGVGTMSGPMTINTKLDGEKKNGKDGKTPKSATRPGGKRKKGRASKGGFNTSGGTTPAATPGAS